MSSNFGTGFSAFKATIEMLTEDLGGGKNIRKAVADKATSHLNYRMQQRRGDSYPSLTTYSTAWTEATDMDFDHTCERLLTMVMRQRVEDPIDAEAPFNGAALRLRGDTMWLEGRNYALLFGSCSFHTSYDYKARADIEKWSAGLSDAAEECLKEASGWSLRGNTSTGNARSLAGAQKALQNLVSKYAKVTFSKPAETA